MKVICIDPGPRYMSPLVLNEIYHVIGDDHKCPFCNGPMYELQEYPGNPFHADRFIPVSDIDETELVNKKEGII
jgi:hypothetical protein